MTIYLGIVNIRLLNNMLSSYRKEHKLVYKMANFVWHN